MKSITKLKDEARKHEQKEEWEKAIKVYLQVLESDDEAGGGELELPLFNRVGDLYVRLGRSKDAVHYYEQAADRYADAGLFNNAIALCNKALRYMPGHLELLRKLGQFSASQGFLTDARRYFLEYSEKKFAAGETDAGLQALADFAASADDPEVRELLGRKLQQHGRPADAVQELKRAWEMRVRAGEGMAADALRAEILAIDPGAFAPQLGMPEPAAHAPAAGLADVGAPEEFAADRSDNTGPGDELAEISLAEVSPEAAAQAAEPAEGGEFHIELPGLETGRAEPIELPGPEEEALLAGFESTSFDGFSEVEAAALPDLEASAEFEAPADAAALQIEGLDRPVMEVPPVTPQLDTTGFEESIGGETEDVAFQLPDIESGGELDQGGASLDLPLLGDEGEEEAPPLPLPEDAAPLPLLEPFPEQEPEAQEFEAEAGLSEIDVLPALDATPSQEAAEPLPLLESGSLPELAEVSGTAETPELAEAPAPMAVPEADEAAAAVAPEQTAEPVTSGTAAEMTGGWDPSQLGPAPPAAERATSAAAAQTAPPPAGGYIDLATLLTEDEEQKDTRFVVEEKAPTGDEDRDFAELLTQFKQKVAEHVSAEDAAAHYDLGLAFKEMGLIDEAISEFQVALRAGDMRLKVYEELGHCFLLREHYNIAEKVLRRALESKYQDELELLGVYYHLGRAYEAMGKREQARDSYERVLALDINFQDVAARLARL